MIKLNLSHKVDFQHHDCNLFVSADSSSIQTAWGATWSVWLKIRRTIKICINLSERQKTPEEENTDQNKCCWSNQKQTETFRPQKNPLFVVVVKSPVGF